MPLSIEIPEIHIAALREFYLNKKEILLAELKTIDNVLSQMSTNNLVPTGKSLSQTLSAIYPPGYPIDALWQDKIIYAIKHTGGESTTSSIANYVCNIERDLDRRKVVATISSVLSTQSKDGGVFGKRLNPKKENVYFINDLANGNESENDNQNDNTNDNQNENGNLFEEKKKEVLFSLDDL